MFVYIFRVRVMYRFMHIPGCCLLELQPDRTRDAPVEVTAVALIVGDRRCWLVDIQDACVYFRGVTGLIEQNICTVMY